MSENKEASFVSHLDELRTRIIRSFSAILICAVLALAFSKKIIALLTIPIDKLVFIEPQEAFVTNVVVALWSGVFLAAPFVFFQIWKFISSGLNNDEKRYIASYGPLSFILFITGACFGYFVILPVGLKFLLGFSSDSIVPMITLNKYISFVCMITINFGIAFELPITIVFLTKAGLVTPEFLISKRKHAIVIIFIASAILTPPDIITQCMMALPLIGLLDIGIYFSKMVYKNRQ